MSRGAGMDAGRSAVRLMELNQRKGAIALTRYHAVPVAPGESPRTVVADSFGPMRARLAPIRVGLTGSDVMLRYLPVPQVEDWRLERLMDFEVRELEARSGGSLATSFNLLPVPKELDEDDTILLGLVKEDLLSEWLEALGRLPVQAFTSNAVALYNAYLALGDHAPGVTLIANLGAGSLDLALVRGAELAFARSVTTRLEKRDATLASRLGVDPARAQRLIHKHLDLRAGLGERLSPDAERVTRPLLPLYEPLPTLMAGMVTLCKAQARLRDLKLDRVLLCGGGSAARGLTELLASRLGVPVEIWNPTELVDADSLPEEQFEQLQADGPAAAVALGLALSAADPDLYALEILPERARRQRDFRERGIYAVLAGVLAVLFLIADFVVNSGRASAAEDLARRLQREVQAAERNDRTVAELEQRIDLQRNLMADVSAREALRRSANEFLGILRSGLPTNLWVEEFSVQLQAGDDWGMPGVRVPVVHARGRGEDRERRADAVFTEFADRIRARLPRDQQALRISSQVRKGEFEWTMDAQLLALPAPEDEDAPDSTSSAGGKR